jgi:hypothetical protein
MSQGQINTNIRGNTQYNRDSTFFSEAEMSKRLTDMRNSLDLDSHEMIMQYKQQEYDKEMADLQKQFDIAIKLKTSEEKLEDNFNKKKKEYRKKLAQENKTTRSKEYKDWLKEEEKKHKIQVKYLKELAKKQAATLEIKTSVKGLGNISKENNILSTLNSISDNSKKAGLKGTLDGLISGISDLAKQLDNQIDTIANYQSAIDTRLLGSGKKYEGTGGISQKITGIAGVSPLIKQEDVIKKIDDYVKQGIAYDVEQRAFLQVISDKIATTFDAANGTLLQLVRIQQSDTTAARLGEEAALNSYLNSMFQTTEYLSDVSSSVKSSLYEATAQLSATAGVGLEYTVQKWLGSLYSVGMSSSSVSNIASALGMLGSGNVSGLMNNSSMQNLLVMSASKAGLPYADLLTKGLDSSNTNKLMKAMVSYLSEIANSNKIVQSQYANVFGMSMSDITAAGNLTSSLKDIYQTTLDYNGALGTLYSTANTMYSRTSIGEMMSNVWENVKYSMSAGIASNPALYAIWKAATLLEDIAGGIALPDIKVMGSGANLQTTVADLMRVGALSGGILSSIGSMIGAGSGGGISPTGMLNSLGISPTGVSTISRGSSTGVITSGSTVSQSNYVGNSSGSDVYSSTMSGATDTQNSKMAEAKESSDSVTMDTIDGHIVDIYTLLNSIINNNAMTVRLTDSMDFALN